MIINGEFCDWECQSPLSAFILCFNFATIMAVTVFSVVPEYINITRRVRDESNKEWALRFKYIAMMAWGVGMLYP
jgi:hypothetical protein